MIVEERAVARIDFYSPRAIVASASSVGALGCQDDAAAEAPNLRGGVRLLWTDIL
jgi:hypothetical protein